jgi:hypothetical protein
LNELIGRIVIEIRHSVRSARDRISILENCDAIGAKARGFMSKQIQYSEEPLGDIEVVPDFLSPPQGGFSAADIYCDSGGKKPPQ